MITNLPSVDDTKAPSRDALSSSSNVLSASMPASTVSDAMTAPATPNSAVSDASGADPLAHELKYTLTVEQARERFLLAKRKVPSVRTLQRYGDEGTIAALKIKTMFGNVPGREWLFNEDDLERHMASQPMIETLDAPLAPQTQSVSAAAKTTAAPASPVSVAAPPVADVFDDVPGTIGERRNLAEVLIENARLAAQIEGRDAVITELRDDKAFLRDEVREGRKTRDDVKTSAQRMIDVFKTMADSQLAGRLRSAMAPEDFPPVTGMPGGQPLT